MSFGLKVNDSNGNETYNISELYAVFTDIFIADAGVSGSKTYDNISEKTHKVMVSSVVDVAQYNVSPHQAYISGNTVYYNSQSLGALGSTASMIIVLGGF